jgi:hypothetical protein
VKIAIMAPLVTAIREPQRGGSQAFVSDLARGLASRGHDVHVYAASGSEIPGVEVIDTGVDPESLAGTLYRAFGHSGPAGSRRPGPSQRRPSLLSPAPIAACRKSGMTWSIITPSTRPPSGSRRRCRRRWYTRSTCPRTRRWRRHFGMRPGAADRRQWPPYRHSRRAPGAGSSVSTRSCRLTCPHTSSPGRGRRGRAPSSRAG